MATLDDAYECLQYYEVEGFTQENKETTYYLQKSYMQDMADGLIANSKPLYQGNVAKQLIPFYEEMLDYYGLPHIVDDETGLVEWLFNWDPMGNPYP